MSDGMDFNKRLIGEIKLFNGQFFADDLVENKYAFITYLFSKLESKDPKDLTIVGEEYPSLKSNVDAYYKDEDSGVADLYIGLFDEKADDLSFCAKEEVDGVFEKTVTFLKMTLEGKQYNFDLNSLTFEVANSISQNVSGNDSNVVVNLFVNKRVPEKFKRDSVENIGRYSVAFRTYDLDDLKNKFGELQKETNELDCEKTFGQGIAALKIASHPNADVFLLGMKGVWLAHLYKTDSIRLLEPNVRSYLKRTSKVNAGILDTIENEPEYFASYNNGISAVATDVKFKGGGSDVIETISNFQIVNGGQTTATLAEATKEDYAKQLNNIVVPVKLTVVKNLTKANELISNISTFSNTQTAIKKSDPPSNAPFFKAYEKLSRQIVRERDDGTDYICYFERTNGQYDTDLMRNKKSAAFKSANPNNLRFTKIDLALAVNCWQQKPHVGCMGKEKSFNAFFDAVKKHATLPDEQFFKQSYALVLLLRHLDDLAKRMELTYKSNVIAYALSLASFTTGKRLDLMAIWDEGTVPSRYDAYFLEVMPKISEIINAASPNVPEPRMWARKEGCWEKVKQIVSLKPLSRGVIVDFYPESQAFSFISVNDNLFNGSLWLTLILWDAKNKVLSDKDRKMAKYMRTLADKQGTNLTDKQRKYALDVFLNAAAHGFDYKKIR